MNVGGRLVQVMWTLDCDADGRDGFAHSDEMIMSDIIFKEVICDYGRTGQSSVVT